MSDERNDLKPVEINAEERMICEGLARDWWHGDGYMSFSALVEALAEARSTARRGERVRALEECAFLCDRARPAGGRAWSEGQQGAFEALAHVADYIRALAAEKETP